MNNISFEETYQIARERSPEVQEIVAIYMQHALANKPVSPEGVSTLRGLAQALQGEGYTETEAQARMESRLSTAKT